LRVIESQGVLSGMIFLLMFASQVFVYLVRPDRFNNHRVDIARSAYVLYRTALLVHNIEPVVLDLHRVDLRNPEAHVAWQQVFVLLRILGMTEQHVVNFQRVVALFQLHSDDSRALWSHQTF
jgi:hypothetical protein